MRHTFLGGIDGWELVRSPYTPEAAASGALEGRVGLEHAGIRIPRASGTSTTSRLGTQPLMLFEGR
jgi:hypothetical protein